MFDRIEKRGGVELVRLAVVVALVAAIIGGFLVTALRPPPSGAVLRAEAEQQLRGSQAKAEGR